MSHFDAGINSDDIIMSVRLVCDRFFTIYYLSVGCLSVRVSVPYVRASSSLPHSRRFRFSSLEFSLLIVMVEG
jgi:hypothetical protein